MKRLFFLLIPFMVYGLDEQLQVSDSVMNKMEISDTTAFFLGVLSWDEIGKKDTIPRVSIHDTVVIMNKDTLEKVYKTILTPQYPLPENPYPERQRIKKMYKTILALDPDSSSYTTLDTLFTTTRKVVTQQADSCLNAWRENYPVAVRLERGKNVMVGVGIYQIGVGVLGNLLTIIHANSSTNYSFKIDKQTYKGSYENEWSSFHTMALILSMGFVVSGIITVNF